MNVLMMELESSNRPDYETITQIDDYSLPSSDSVRQVIIRIQLLALHIFNIICQCKMMMMMMMMAIFSYQDYCVLLDDVSFLLRLVSLIRINVQSRDESNQNIVKLAANLLVHLTAHCRSDVHHHSSLP